MGHCIHGAKGLCKQSGVQCYQSGFTKNQPNMTLEDFKSIVDESKGKVFQIALGGRGDVNKHENFEEILAYCRENNIVPNFTTSGLNLTQQEVEIAKKYCGAVAISWYRQQHTFRAINMFIDAGVKTNIHYVLGKFSIEEAIYQLRVSGDSLTELGYPLEYVIENKLFPEGVNAVLFLAHKPVGQGDEVNVLNAGDAGIEDFFTLVDEGKYPFKIGFDSCSICGVLNHTNKINMDSCDFCEGARYSMYITPDMKALPCSFDQAERWAVPLQHNIGEGFTYTIKEAWDSYKFDNFRSHFKSSCPTCPERMLCMGGCPIVPQVSLCDREEKMQNREALPEETK
jgi:radical SAM protein with 4Fe4S-binding SPASM domain